METSVEPVFTIQASEAKPGQLYLTYQSRTRIYVEYVTTDNDAGKVLFRSYQPQHAEWRNAWTLLDYKLKVLTPEEQQLAREAISKSSGEIKREQAKRTYKKGPVRENGTITGLGMISAWGKYFIQFAGETNKREKIRKIMKKEFPNKHESIDRWINAYRSYYNKGKLPGLNGPPVLQIDHDSWLT